MEYSLIVRNRFIGMRIMDAANNGVSVYGRVFNLDSEVRGSTPC
jgi:hypothetical protein